MAKKRVPLYRQLEANDCGPTCLQMVCGYYGRRYSLKTIKQFCDMTRLGISLNDLTHCCKALGFYSESVKISIDEAHRMPVPAILYFKKGHFVVLEHIVERKGKYVYTIADPAYGRVKMDEENLMDKWMMHDMGIALVLAPEGDEPKDLPTIDDERQMVGRMKSAVRNTLTRHKRNFFWIALLTLIVVVTNWAMPLLLKTTIDEGIMQKNINVVWTMLAGQFCFFLGFMLAGNVSNLITTKTSIKIDLKFITDYFNKIIKLPMQFFDVGLRSDLIQKLSDLNRISSFITGNILSIVFAVLNVLVFSTVLLVYNYEVFAIFCFFSLISFAYNSYFIRKRKYIDYAIFSISSERSNAIYEMIMGMSEIKINNAQGARIAVWRKLEDKMNRLRIRSMYLDYHMNNGASLLGKLRDICLTGICALFVIDGDMTMGTMMMISFLLGQLSSPVNELISFSRNVQDAKLSFGRINDVYERKDEVSPTNKSLEGKSIKKGIALEHVYFKYAGLSSPFVLKDVNLHIPIGKITALVGASGSGKTTLLKLLLGFYYPNKGDITVDSVKMNTINMESWRAKCGVVMQDGRIFSGSVAENIAFADETPNEKQLVYATKVAAIYDRIMDLPMGFNTRIGETGVDLSGGEKQRIFIARAVYKNPEFIFLDEATSSLDANTERTIIQNLRKFYSGRTVVVIAHRLSTVKDADNIVFMDQGKIAEHGSHEELLAANGLYKKLVENQLALD